MTNREQMAKLLSDIERAVVDDLFIHRDTRATVMARTTAIKIGLSLEDVQDVPEVVMWDGRLVHVTGEVG